MSVDAHLAAVNIHTDLILKNSRLVRDIEWQNRPFIIRPAVQVLFPVTKFDDLYSTPALGQILGAPIFDWRIQFVLPNEAAKAAFILKAKESGLSNHVAVTTIEGLVLSENCRYLLLTARHLLLPAFLYQAGNSFLTAKQISTNLTEAFQLTKQPEISNQLNLNGLEAGSASEIYQLFWEEVPTALQRQTAQVSDRSKPEVGPERVIKQEFACYLNRGGAGNDVIRAMARSIRSPLRYAEDTTVLNEIPIVWGVLRGSMDLIHAAMKSGTDFYYIDHAYFGRGHGKNYRITRNRFEAGPIIDCPEDRRLALELELKPWQQSGENILICPPTEYFMNAHDCRDWLPETIATLKQHTDRTLVVREKPRRGQTIEPLEEAFTRAHALVTHSSNIAIEAVIAGIPVFVSPSSAAAAIAKTDLSGIEEPTRPSRTRWLNHLAYNQFSFDEIQGGIAWSLLQKLGDGTLSE